MIILYHMGFYQPYFQESKVWIQFYQNPSFGDKFHVIHTKSIPKVVSIPWLAWSWLLHLLPFFSSPSPSRFVLLPKMRPTLVFLIPCLLRPCLTLQIKPIFGLSCLICKKVPPCLTICISSFLKLYFGP